MEHRVPSWRRKFEGLVALEKNNFFLKKLKKIKK